MTDATPTPKTLNELPVNCLLVDDLEENLLALSALLGSESVHIFTARSGPEALELLLEHDFALALLDVQMPLMDGFELAELMRGSERTRQVPIIFLTAGSRDQHRLFKGYEAGGVDFIYKPIEPAVLKNKAEIFFSLHRHKLQLARDLDDRTSTLHWNEMFTAVLGHDLRNPLAAVLASAEYIQATVREEQAKRSAQRIADSALRMARMIDDLFDLARARLGGGIRVSKEFVDLGAIVERVVQESATARPERSIRFVREGALEGHWDPNRLAQVASNLIGNALTHGAAESPVDVVARSVDDDMVELAVTNDGRIPLDRLDRIFDPFVGGQRRDTAKGLGLGLYIVQQITLAHEGTVDVETGEGKKVSFHVRLPRSAAPALKRPMPRRGFEA